MTSEPFETFESQKEELENKIEIQKLKNKLVEEQDKNSMTRLGGEIVSLVVNFPFTFFLMTVVFVIGFYAGRSTC